MTREFTLHATTREWVDGEGKKHKVRIEVGAIFRSKAGSFVVKLDAVPITKDWSGWLAAVPCTPQCHPAAAFRRGCHRRHLSRQTAPRMKTCPSELLGSSLEGRPCGRLSRRISVARALAAPPHLFPCEKDRDRLRLNLDFAELAGHRTYRLSDVLRLVKINFLKSGNE